MTPTRPIQADIYLPLPATVVRTESVTALEKFFEVRLGSGRPLGHMPGQFVEVSLPGVGEAPISISSPPGAGDTFDLVVRNVGNVTRAMHGLAAGDALGIRGPYGTHFPVDGALKGKDLLFVCGGIGLVPVRSAINYCLDHRGDYGRIQILFGARTPDDRLFVSEARERWSRAPDTLYLETVDRGDKSWKGNVGVITTLLPRIAIDPARTAAVICGPPIMYKFVIVELRRMGLAMDQVYLSLERHMKCGVGKCGHCQINGRYVCQDGAVFRYGDVEAVREAIQ